MCPPAPDWGPQHQVTGALELPEHAVDWTPSAALRKYLGEGPAPVLMSLGSMEHLAPRRAHGLMTEAAGAAGVRAIIQSKRLTEERREGGLYFLPWAPHGALLQHCSLMVHHGGAGTTHAALQAGRPALVVPFIMEQQLWGGRLRQAGAGENVGSFWKLTAERLGARIRRALGDAGLRDRAAKLGAELNQERGGATATHLIERLVAQRTVRG